MNIYIAYKFTNVEDKKSLKEALENFSSIIADLGHKTFLLGRDKKKWASIKFPLWKTIPVICKNITRSDAIVAYITGNEKSPGLAFELIFAWIVGKPVYTVFKNGDLKCKFIKKFSKKIIYIDDMSQLKEKLAHELK